MRKSTDIEFKSQFFYGLYRPKFTFRNESQMKTSVTYFVDLHKNIWISVNCLMSLGWQYPETLQPEDTIRVKDVLGYPVEYVECVAAIVNEPDGDFAHRLEQWRQVITGELRVII